MPVALCVTHRSSSAVVTSVSAVRKLVKEAGAL